MLFTVKELLIRPGVTIRKLIQKDRNRLVKSIIYTIISSLIYTLLRELLHFKDDYLYADSSNSTTTTIALWIKNNYGYANLIMGVFIVFWIQVFFRK